VAHDATVYFLMFLYETANYIIPRCSVQSWNNGCTIHALHCTTSNTYVFHIVRGSGTLEQPQSRHAITCLKIIKEKEFETCARESHISSLATLHDEAPSSLGVSMFTPTEGDPRHVLYDDLVSRLSHRIVSDLDVRNGTVSSI
jgi:hypothetical protein